jgi:uncharacterized protein YifE (UPF0438 family)
VVEVVGVVVVQVKCRGSRQTNIQIDKDWHKEIMKQIKLTKKFNSLEKSIL